MLSGDLLRAGHFGAAGAALAGAASFLGIAALGGGAAREAHDKGNGGQGKEQFLHLVDRLGDVVVEVD